MARVRRDGGQVARTRVLPGVFTVPAVALDGSAGGLSANGGTLVLIKPRARFPRRRTPFVVLDARRLRVRDRFTLRGDFSFDALSPDGRSMFLIQYLSRRDPTRYAVRVFDLRTRRMLPKPIVDASEPDEQMRGYPITRATSADGAVGVHALRRRRLAPVRARARHRRPRRRSASTSTTLAAARISTTCASSSATAADARGPRRRGDRAPRSTWRRIGATAAPPRPRARPERSAGGGPAAWTVVVSIAAALLIAGGFAARSPAAPGVSAGNAAGA